MNTELRLFVKALFPKRVLFKYEQNLRFFFSNFTGALIINVPSAMKSCGSSFYQKIGTNFVHFVVVYLEHGGYEIY